MEIGCRVLGFAFDDLSNGKEINGFPILCNTYNAYERYKNFNDVGFIFQIYRPDILRERIDLKIALKYLREDIFICSSILYGFTKCKSW